MMQKKRLRKIFIGICCSITLCVYSLDNFDIFDELNIGTEFLDSPVPDMVRQSPPDQIIDVLINIDAHKILQEDLFCRTNPLNTRNIIDNPLFLPQKIGTYEYCSVFGAQLFWNSTNRMYFDSHSSNIESFLGISNPNLLEKIQDSIPKIKQFFPDFSISPINILALFKNMTIQERKIGLMFHGEHQNDWGNFRAYIPLYYIERNFFLTEGEQQRIEEELGALDTESQDEFAEQHLISDKFGLGDMRLTCDALLYGRESTTQHCFGIRGGLLATIPTAVAFKKGLKGSFFPKNTPRPVFEFTPLFDAESPTQATELVQNFLFPVLDHLSALLIDTELGNGGHFGIGGLLKTVTPLSIFIARPWAECVYAKSFVSLEYLLPKNEERFFIEGTDLAQFNALGLNKDIDTIAAAVLANPELAQEILTFLEQQFVESLFPFVFKTLVHPGFVFRWATRFFYEQEHWGFCFGSELWVQGKEKLNDIQKCGDRPATLDIQKAVKPVAYQSKILGSIFYTSKRDCKDWLIALNINDTIAHSGIGSDFSVSLNFEVNF